MKIGFTGTQSGMCIEQKRMLYNILTELMRDENKPTEFHHGDCIGADAEAHDIVQLIGGIDLILHPPENDKKRAFCEGYARRAHPKPYLERNRRIVDSVDLLIVAPKEQEETLRSGTWSTYRYAKRKRVGRIMIMILPRSEDQ